jgi:hypothetical protein
MAGLLVIQLQCCIRASMPGQRVWPKGFGRRIFANEIHANKKPRTVSRPGLSYPSVRRWRSEVTLSANVERDRVLVLELVDRARLRSRRCQNRCASEVLVEAGVHHFGRERQVLDGGPAGDATHLEHREVGVAAKVRRLCTGAGSVRIAVSCLGRAIVANL